MPKQARKNQDIRRGIYFGRAILGLLNMYDYAGAKRALRNAASEPRYTYIACLRTLQKAQDGGFDNVWDLW